MALVTGGELVVRELRKAGVEKLFALHGAHVDSLFQACLDNDLLIVDTRHEVNAGHAAEGYARVAQKLGVAVITSGGGMTNVVTSMANAMMDRTPVLYLCGSGALPQRQTNTMQADVDQVAVATPLTKWAHHVTCIEQLPRLVAQAIRIANQAPRGPVMLDLPFDVLTGKIEESEPAAAGPSELRSVKPSRSDVADIVEKMSRAQRPVVIVGSEAFRGDAGADVGRLAAATGAPVFAEFEGLAVLRDLPADSRGGLVQGLYGLGDQAPDFVLMAGMRFSVYSAHGSGTLIPHSADIVQIDPDAREIGRLQPVALGLVADVSLALAALAEAAEDSAEVDRASWRKVIRDHIARRYAAISDRVPESADLLHPLRASDVVAEFVSGDVTVVADGALTYLWLSEVIAEAKPEAFLCHSHLSSMGFGFGVAVGAQAAVAPGKRVLLVTGDGAVGYSLGEFDTAVRNKLPLIVIVMNNRSWGATLHFQEIVDGPDRVTGTRLENGRYDGVAGALGAGAYFASDAETFRAALRDALSKDEPACINVLVDLAPIPPEELVIMGMDPFNPPPPGSH